MKVIAEAGTSSSPALVDQVSASLRVSHLIYRRSADVENPVTGVSELVTSLMPTRFIILYLFYSIPWARIERQGQELPLYQILKVFKIINEIFRKFILGQSGRS